MASKLPPCPPRGGRVRGNGAWPAAAVDGAEGSRGAWSVAAVEGALGDSAELGRWQRWMARRTCAERGWRQPWRAHGPGRSLAGGSSGKLSAEQIYAAAGPNEAAGLIARGSCGRCELTSQGRRERRTTRLASGSSGGRRALRGGGAERGVARGSCGRGELTSQGRERRTTRLASGARGSCGRGEFTSQGRRERWKTRRLAERCRDAQDAARAADAAGASAARRVMSQDTATRAGYVWFQNACARVVTASRLAANNTTS
jgi:hypothetical protein